MVDKNLSLAKVAAVLQLIKNQLYTRLIEYEILIVYALWTNTSFILFL